MIIEDDSRVSRVVRNHLEENFENIRVTIAGSPQKAREMLEKFPPTFIIWDGTSNAQISSEQYINCIPTELWQRVIPISASEDLQKLAQEKGSHPPLPKKTDGINSWSEGIVNYIKPRLPKKKK